MMPRAAERLSCTSKWDHLLTLLAVAPATGTGRSLFSCQVGVHDMTYGLEVPSFSATKRLPLKEDLNRPGTSDLNTIGSAFVKILVSRHCGKLFINKIMNKQPHAGNTSLALCYTCRFQSEWGSLKELIWGGVGQFLSERTLCVPSFFWPSHFVEWSLFSEIWNSGGTQ